MRNYIKPDGKFYFRSILILVFSLIVTISIFFIVSDSIEKNSQDIFDNEINKIQKDIQEKLSMYEQILKSGEAFLYSSEVITRDEWFAFVDIQEITQRYPGIQGVGFQKHTSDEKEFLEDMEELRSKNLLFRDIPKIDNTGHYNYIIFLEPVDERNKQALGYDMSSESTRNDALTNAAAKNTVTITGKVTLVQEITEKIQAGFLMYLPIYEKNAKTETKEERLSNLIGYVYAPFRMDDFMDTVQHDNNSIGYTIYDSKNNTEDIMYEVNSTDNEAKIILTKKVILNFYDRDWVISFYGTDGLVSDINKNLPNVILIMGVSISIFLFISSNGNKTLNSYKQRQIKLLEQTNKQKDEFSAMVTHELRTPLTPILGNVDFLNNPAICQNLTDEQKQAINSIEKNAMHLDSLITDVLDAEKLNMSKMRFHYEHFDVKELFNEINDNFKQTIKEKNISMSVMVEKSLTVYSDRKRIQQVLENLLRNACDFVQNDSGKITLAAFDNDTTIKCYVKDNGIGMSPEAQSDLFKKFYQIDTSQKRKHGGNGLGLSICKGIIDALGGKIWVESQVNKGSTFYFLIPKNKPRESVD